MERQGKNVSLDHLFRYRFAAQIANANILDAACGNGYGADIMAANKNRVTAVDIHPLPTAVTTFTFIQGDIANAPWGSKKFSHIVSFETLEHLKNPDMAMAHFAASLKPGGFIIASVPNEDVFHFDPKIFEDAEYPHQRHYTPEEFDELFLNNGFDVFRRFTQIDKHTDLIEGSHGRTLIWIGGRQ